MLQFWKRIVGCRKIQKMFAVTVLTDLSVVESGGNIEKDLGVLNLKATAGI
jgi:hypothetical protein